MTPIGELRASIPIALTVYHLPPLKAFFWSVLGNIIPGFFFLWFLTPLVPLWFRHGTRAPCPQSSGSRLRVVPSPRLSTYLLPSAIANCWHSAAWWFIMPLVPHDQYIELKGKP
jgi:hypothetical protein